MQKWRETPRVQSFIPRRGSHNPQAHTARRLRTRRILTKLFQVRFPRPVSPKKKKSSKFVRNFPAFKLI